MNLILKMNLLGLSCITFYLHELWVLAVLLLECFNGEPVKHEPVHLGIKNNVSNCKWSFFVLLTFFSLHNKEHSVHYLKEYFLLLFWDEIKLTEQTRPPFDLEAYVQDFLFP